jgi:addiction module HigA family antidote
VRFDPDWCLSPGSILREELAEWNITPKMLASSMGTTVENVEGVLNGAPLTEKFAERLSRALPVSAQFWLNLEDAYRRGLAAGKKDVS